MFSFYKIYTVRIKLTLLNGFSAAPGYLPAIAGQVIEYGYKNGRGLTIYGIIQSFHKQGVVNFPVSKIAT